MLSEKHHRKIKQGIDRVLAGHPNKSKLDVALQTIEPHKLMQHHRPHGSGLNLAGSKSHTGSGLNLAGSKSQHGSGDPLQSKVEQSQFYIINKPLSFSNYSDFRTTNEYHYSHPPYMSKRNSVML